ncbi:DUF3365 domain-containing protein [Agriterribacter sp.]|uniref:Tll0287-like domain-containing protein n=1 Tax=Agriterribacter sp. TaxID=2821509 RepID=UPI002CDCF519|nr:DUF3365 domain-containing protein [Agriterribacter sp.]HRO47878.1 DUF3365 domain-containing protein [Agriterribacter sp.]HRQ18826.1 DUF3365 domain-containing protein [Agriterribacter sp.]
MKRPYYAYILTACALISVSCRQPDTAAANDYRAQGDSIIKATFDTLRNALTIAIHNKGLQGAVAYCNENAYPVTAVLASGNITIKRVAEKYRNPKNAPDSTDAIQWRVFTAAKANGDSLQPAIIAGKNIVHYYKPILLQPMCSACHGKTGKDIPLPVAATIDSLYPNDKAKDFTVGDLRGMWKISFAQ